jgi:rhodanese-related sulfurtransferase
MNKRPDRPDHIVLDIRDPEYDESKIDPDVHAQKVKERDEEDALNA